MRGSDVYKRQVYRYAMGSSVFYKSCTDIAFDSSEQYAGFCSLQKPADWYSNQVYVPNKGEGTGDSETVILQLVENNLVIAGYFRKGGFYNGIQIRHRNCTGNDHAAGYGGCKNSRY